MGERCDCVSETCEVERLRPFLERKGRRPDVQMSKSKVSSLVLYMGVGGAGGR
jgi:hypothetical protein